MASGTCMPRRAGAPRVGHCAQLPWQPARSAPLAAHLPLAARQVPTSLGRLPTRQLPQPPASSPAASRGSRRMLQAVHAARARRTPPLAGVQQARPAPALRVRGGDDAPVRHLELGLAAGQVRVHILPLLPAEACSTPATTVLIRTSHESPRGMCAPSPHTSCPPITRDDGGASCCPPPSWCACNSSRSPPDLSTASTNRSPPMASPTHWFMSRDTASSSTMGTCMTHQHNEPMRVGGGLTRPQRHLISCCSNAYRRSAAQLLEPTSGSPAAAAPPPGSRQCVAG